MKKTVLAILGLAMTTTSFVSCSEDLLTNESQSTVSARNGKTMRFDDFFFRKKEIAMRDFSEALLKVISENKEVRELIKTEALKQFNNDTEVLALYLVEQNVKGQPLFNLFEKHLQGKTSLREIFQIIPTLTILVPELPEDSFSAKKWDTNSQLPDIAIRTELSNNTPVIGILDNKIATDVIPSDIIPAEPILVIKENERVVSSQNPTFYKLNTQVFYKSSSLGILYKFLDKIYNSNINFNGPNDSDQREVYEAYELTKNKNAWQRDHIYYGINPNNPNGVFNYAFKEYLNFIEPVEHNGSAYGAYKAMSDQTDPYYNQVANSSNNFTHWTDGSFEIVVNALLNGVNEIDGVTYQKHVSARPQDIFKLEVEHYRTGNRIFGYRNHYKVTNIKAKRLWLNNELFNWNLEHVGTIARIVIEEYDTTEKHERTFTHQSKLATNFEINSGTSEKTKIGMKFGASAESTSTYTHKIESTLGADKLGDSVIDFGEPVVVNKSTLRGLTAYTYNTYSTASIKFGVSPKKVLH